MKNEDRHDPSLQTSGLTRRTATSLQERREWRPKANELLVPMFLEDVDGTFCSTTDLVDACHADDELLRLAARVVATPSATGPSAAGAVDIVKVAVAMPTALRTMRPFASALRTMLEVRLVDEAVRVLDLCVELVGSTRSRPRVSPAHIFARSPRTATALPKSSKKGRAA